MPAPDIVRVVTHLSAAPVSGASFSVPLIAAILTGQQLGNWDSEDTVRTVTPDSWQAELANLGVTSSEELYVALRTMFTSQAGFNTPSEVKIGRRGTAVAQTQTITIAQNVDGDYVATLNGVDYETTASGAASVTAVRDLLLTAMGGAGTHDGVTLATSSTDSISAVAAEPGVAFTLSVSHSTTPAAITASLDVASVGAQEDYAAWRAEDPDFWLVLETTRSRGVQRMLAAAVATSGSGADAGAFFLGQTNDPDANSASADDIGTLFGATGLNYARAGLVWDADPDQFTDAAIASKMLPLNPGRATWANQSLTGVVGQRFTTTTNLRAKRYTWNEAFPASQGGFSMTQGGRAAAGYPIDLIRSRDWLNNRILIRMLVLLRDELKVPMTSDGIALTENALLEVLELASSRDYPILQRSTIRTFPPAASSFTSEQIAAGRLPPVAWRAAPELAVEQIEEITGNLVDEAA